MADAERPKAPIGWREWIVLPELCPTPIKVKVDTGAQTSALHAFKLRIADRGDRKVASFIMHPHQRSIRDSLPVEAEVIGYKRIRSSNGKVERRPIIATTAVLGDTTMPIEITLTRRDEMGFRMLLGRAATRKRFLVDPGGSFIATPRQMGTMR